MIFSLIGNISFVNPLFFILLLLVPILAVWYYFKRGKRFPLLRMSANGENGVTTSLRGKFRALLPILRILSIASLVFAMARPQEILKEEEVKADGIDIVLAMDLSSSMLAQDFQPDRLEVSKAVAIEFVEKRKYDRIGLAVFAGESFTQCPLTTDHRVVQEFLASLQCGMLEDGTAIGMGLATAVNRLKDSEVKSKVVILLTDGVNNQGYIKPITAAEIAREFDIRVYTIGVGSTGQARSPVRRRQNGQYIFGMSKVEIDEALLTQISEMTGGKYFRATSAENLIRIYDEIDRLEKTEIDVTSFNRYNEEFYTFVFIAILLLLLEVILRYTILRVIP